MNLDVPGLQQLLRQRLCEAVRIETRPDGRLMVNTPFRFPDGDTFPIYLSKAESGALQLSDCGHTLMQISYEHEVDSFLDGRRGLLLEQIVTESGLRWDAGVFSLEVPPTELSEAILRFGQAMTRVFDLTLLSRSNIGSTFYNDLADLICRLLDEDKVQRDFQPDVPNAPSYAVDYRIEGRDGVPLFLYGVPNRDKARLTAIMLAHFHRHRLPFESLLVFKDQAEIPGADLARLSDLAGESISSLQAEEDLRRKLARRTDGLLAAPTMSPTK